MEVKKLSEQGIIEAKKEIAKVLEIDEKYIYYGFDGSNEFLITNCIVGEKHNKPYFDNRDATKRLKILNFNFSILEKYFISFRQCDFDCHINHLVDSDFEYIPSKCNPFVFNNCKFLKSFSLNLSFLQVYRCIFQNCLFQDSVCISFEFSQDTYFENCIFEKQASFKNAIFEKNVSFYGSTFNFCPNFAQCYFNGSINLVNTKPNFDCKSIRQEVIKEVKNYQFEVGNTRDFNTIVNDFRDSFRLFKNTLSKEGNILDASNYHRVELYCKEIELDSKEHQVFSREWVDFFQLWFYRLTSDHHTDLAKILNNVIMLIALFGIFAFGLNTLEPHQSHSPTPQRFIFGSLSDFSPSSGFYILGGLLGIGILSEIWKLYISHHKGVFLFFLWRNIPSMALLIVLWAFGYVSFALFSPMIREAVFILMMCLAFIGLFLLSLCKKSKVWIAIAYLINLGILIFKPSLLLPFVGQLFDEGLKANFPAMQSLSVVYCILMFLMLFSLQKTARKNSIIPS